MQEVTMKPSVAPKRTGLLNQCQQQLTNRLLMMGVIQAVIRVLWLAVSCIPTNTKSYKHKHKREKSSPHGVQPLEPQTQTAQRHLKGQPECGKMLASALLTARKIAERHPKDVLSQEEQDKGGMTHLSALCTLFVDYSCYHGDISEGF